MATATAPDAVDLHSTRRKAAIIRDGQLIEIHCRWCSSQFGKTVYHRWQISGGTLLADRVEDGPRAA